MAIEMQATLTAPVRSLAAPDRARAGHAKLSAKDRMFFAERLEMLLETGSPLHVALASLEANSTPALEPVLAKLREAVTGGSSFSQALAQQPEAFPETYVSLVAAGESGGFLPRVLARLRESEAKRDELRSLMISAFSYPAFLAVFSVGVVVFVLVMVFPKFADIFHHIRDQLPWTTRFFMATSDALRDGWPFFLGGLVLLAAAVYRGVQSGRALALLDRAAQATPVLRELITQLYLVQFLFTLSLSLENGVPLLEALRASRGVVASPGFRAFVVDLERRVETGGTLTEGFSEAPEVPPLATQMISTGEESGGLAFVTGRVAGFYEREWRARLEFISKMVEPVMLLIMGALVGLIVSSLLLPIFKLSTTVS